jgi:Protein of unknown function (DUF3040)
MAGRATDDEPSDDEPMDDRAMDDDPVLRSLGADLERDDPELAALLSGSAPFGRATRIPTSHPALRALVVVLLLGLLLAALLLPMRVVLGMAAMLFILASPMAVCWLLETYDNPAPRHL